MAVVAFQGFPAWPPSIPADWPQYSGGAPGTLFLGPPAPVPLNAGGPANEIVPGWNFNSQAIVAAAEQPPPEVPDPEDSESATVTVSQ